LKVYIWGARGSIPTPPSSAEITEKIIGVLWSAQGQAFSDREAVARHVHSLPLLQVGTVGGNTPCVEVRSGDDFVILDAGSGIRPLGLKLMEGPCGKGGGVVHLLMSHTHWDHMTGFPFFAPAYVPGNKIIVYGLHDRLPERFEIQQNPLHCPVPLDVMPAEKVFKTVQEGEAFQIGVLRITSKELGHPGKSYSFRIEDETGCVVYATDCEHRNLSQDTMRPFLEFYRDADVLIYDSQYTFQEAMLKEDWGHSSSLIGVDIAVAAGIRHLLMFHHEPGYDDKNIADLVERTRRYCQHTHGGKCIVNVAYEGMCIDTTEEPTEINF
jgi:phosphoribosyl 1,2-cyclic phosphodiesterase